jgi:hypothetical protein
MDDTEKEQEIERLLQIRRIGIIETLTGHSFVCVHSFEDLSNGFHRFQFLLPLDQKENFLLHRSWDMHNDDFKPSIQWSEAFLDGRWERKVYYM